MEQPSLPSAQRGARASPNYLGQPSVQRCARLPGSHGLQKICGKIIWCPAENEGQLGLFLLDISLFSLLSQAGRPRCVCKWKFCSVAEAQLHARLLWRGATNSLLSPQFLFLFASCRGHKDSAR